MKTPHKHAELIKAWADGAEIEYRTHETIEWKPVFKGWSWDSTIALAYRIKPEPEPDIVFYGRILLPYFDALPYVNGIGQHQGCLDNLMFVFDGTTGELKSAEVI
jgi:hypothetical protein